MKVLLSGLQILQLGIPSKSVRGPYAANMDCGYVDHRRLRRHQSKLDRARRVERREIEAYEKRFLHRFLITSVVSTIANRR